MQLFFPAVEAVIVTNVSVTPMLLIQNITSDLLKAKIADNKTTLLAVLIKT